MKLRLVWLCGILCLVAPRVSAAENDAALFRQAQQVLTTHCLKCHGPDGKANGGVDYILQRDKLVARDKLVPGKPGDSKIMQLIHDRAMPPYGTRTRMPKDDVAALTRWIEAGAPTERTSTEPRRFLAESEVLRGIRADLEAQPARQRRFLRYFTLANLANAARSEDDLDSDRLALAKLMNALSWHPRIANPVAIDASRVVLRIDLRDYKWNARLWDRLIAVYPYRPSIASADAKAIATLTASELPVLRADWFVATASRAPLYYDLLQLPSTDRALERLLQVDVLNDLQEESVARAGLNGSGVSRNNRVLERHDAGFGAYWRTYDFSANTDRQNIFERPLGPTPADNPFAPAGGEAIFHLPNGLHGYFLMDRNGRRVEKGPTDIVSDPQRPDRAVEAGLSCMSCHARGYLPKADQVRAHVLKNEQAFTKEQRATVMAIYVPEARFKAHVERDNERYLKALSQTGVRDNDPEPITRLTLAYEGEVDLPAAAAEAGLSPDDFKAGLAKLTALSRPLGALLTKGGTVQRQAFQAAFADLARELRIGEDVPGRSAPTTVVEHPFAGHGASILCIAVSSDGKRAVSGSEDRTARLWDVETGRELRRFEGHTGPVSAVAFAGSDTILTGSHDRSARLWDAKTGKEKQRFEGHTDLVTSVAAHGVSFASGSFDKTIRLWKATERQEVACLTGHKGVVRSLAFDASGERLVSASADETVRLWDVKAAKALRVLDDHGYAVLAARFSGDGTRVLSGGVDTAVRVWTLSPYGNDGERQEPMRLEGHRTRIVAVGPIPANATHAWTCASQRQSQDKFFRKWDLTTGKEVAALGGTDKDRVNCAAFAPDGRWALTGGEGHTLRLWKLE